MSSQVEYTNVITTVRPLYCAIDTGLPSWSRSRNSGARASGGRSAPANALAGRTGSSVRCIAAIHTPVTAAAAHRPSVARA